MVHDNEEKACAKIHNQEQQDYKNNPHRGAVAVILLALICSFWVVTLGYRRDHLLLTRESHLTNNASPPTLVALPMVSPSERSCTQKSIGFLKTHKTGSSTVFNILSRYANTYNLSIATPAGVHLCYPRRPPDIRSCLQKPILNRYDLLFNHVGYRPSMKELLRNPSYWFTLLRDPLEYFVSVYTYFGLQSLFKADVETFLRRAEYYARTYESSIRENGFLRIAAYYLLQNELVLDNRANSSTIIKFMEDQFNLVIVSDFFNEGLAILYRDACIPSLSDLTYFVQNKRANRQKWNDTVTSRYRRNLRSALPTYFEVYDHFYIVMKNRISTNAEVARIAKNLSILNDKRYSECILNEAQAHSKSKGEFDPMWQPVKMNAFQVKENSPSYCRKMAWPESTFNKFNKNVHLKQFGPA